MTKAFSTRRLRIPVRSVDGVWECWRTSTSEGGHRSWNLLLDRKSVSDGTFLETMERKARHKVLEEGTPLLVSLTVKPKNSPPEKLLPFLKRYDHLAHCDRVLQYLEPGEPFLCRSVPRWPGP